MSESGRPSRGKDRKPREKGADEKIGRALGKAFGRLKRTKVWRETAQAYREGLEGEGKDER